MISIIYYIEYHVYADGTQLYISLKYKAPLEAISTLDICLSDFRKWINTNKLRINDYIFFIHKLFFFFFSHLRNDIGISELENSMYS